MNDWSTDDTTLHIRFTVPNNSYKRFLSTTTLSLSRWPWVRSATASTVSCVDEAVEAACAAVGDSVWRGPDTRLSPVSAISRQRPGRGRAAGAAGTRDHGLPRSCGVRSRASRPAFQNPQTAKSKLWVFYHLLVGLALHRTAHVHCSRLLRQLYTALSCIIMTQWSKMWATSVMKHV